ncbi:MAG: tetratricopeptide repeat protein [Candidatus Neomarinimicrobiota bacterium]
MTRLAFSRPGGMMRLPVSSVTRTPFLFSAGFVTEVARISEYASVTGVYADAEVSRNLRLGLSSVQTLDTTLEVGLHTQLRLWSYGNISFSLGVQDFVLRQANGELSVDPDQLSFLGVIASEQTVGRYLLNTYMGFGTGALAGASPEADSGAGGPGLGESEADGGSAPTPVYAGFLLNTPIFASRGGLDIIGEFAGGGINFGVRIPVTSDYRLLLGFVGVESLPAFGDTALAVGAPALVVGLDLSVPRLVAAPRVGDAEAAVAAMGPRIELGEGEEGLLTRKMDSTLQQADFLLASLRDSLRIADFAIDNLQGSVAMLEQQRVFLADSVRNMQLRIQMMKSNLNDTMRHLSAALDYFYEGNYRDALQDVEMAIQLNPDLAIAYARRGSIYFRLGDIQRATINWNLALKLDPGYDDVRNVLRALKENRLKSTSLTQP